MTADAPPAGGEAVYSREFPLGSSTLRVSVEAAADGDQIITVATSLPGRLLLHWGVEGGAGYKGGWRLPAERCRPPGSIQYKQRALQTPFSPGGNGSAGQQAVTIRLTGEEVSDALNFVIKEETSGQWFDYGGSNFSVPLRLDIATAGVPAPAAAGLQPPLLPPESVPPLPQELCGIWAYIKWEAAGCPNRRRAGRRRPRRRPPCAPLPAACVSPQQSQQPASPSACPQQGGG